MPAAHAQGQLFQLEGGSSSLYQASGGSFELRTGASEASFGLGVIDGRTVAGGLYRRTWDRLVLTVGDEPIPVRLPTDLFESSHYFVGRGASLDFTGKNTRLFVFAGGVTDETGVTFFRGSTLERPAGAWFLDRRISRRVRLFNRSILSTRQTSISGLEWELRPHIRLAGAGGLGGNQRYFSGSMSAETQPLSLKAEYVDAGDKFRRIVASMPLSSENVHENVLLTVRPWRFMDLSGGRFHLLQFSDRSGGVQATVNQLSTALRLHQTAFAGALFWSDTQGFNTRGSYLSATRNFASRFQGGLYLFHSRSGPSYSLTSTVATLREVVTSRISLVQNVTHSGGGTTVSWGGELLSNPVTVGVNYQTVYSPFEPQKPFRQVLLLTLRLQPLSLLQINTSTYVGPDGAVKYTTYAQGFAYRGADVSPTAARFRFPKYAVRGQVIDDTGKPVSGAALRVGKEMVFTDRDGQFFVLTKKRHPLSIEVRPDDFLIPGQFEAQSCPTSVTPSLYDASTYITVTVHRRKPDPR